MEEPKNSEQPAADGHVENPLLKKRLSKKKFLILMGYTLVLVSLFSWIFFYQLETTDFLNKTEAENLIAASVSSPATNNKGKVGGANAKTRNCGTDSLRGATRDAGSRQNTDSTKLIGRNKADSTKSIAKPAPKPDYTRNIKDIMLKVLLLMLICGVLGGCLGNLRGFFYHYLYDGYFPKVKEIPYYVRPVMGAMTGLFIFFLASFLNSTASYNFEIPKWITITGAIPSLAFAFLAGFACLELMSRLKQIAESLFGYKPSVHSGPEKGTGESNTTDTQVHEFAKKSDITRVSNLREFIPAIAPRVCDVPLSSLSDVYIVVNPDEEVVLFVSEIIGQLALSRVSLNGSMLDDDARDDFSISLGTGSALIGRELQITTTILDATGNVENAGMQVTLNSIQYPYLCNPFDDGKCTFFTNIEFVAQS